MSNATDIDICAGCDVFLPPGAAASTVLDTEPFGIFVSIGVHCSLCTAGVERAARQLLDGVQLLSRHGDVAHVWCQLCGGVFGAVVSAGLEEVECDRCGYEFEVNVLGSPPRRRHLALVR